MAEDRGARALDGAIAELEEAVRRAPRVPITGRILMDEEEVLDLLREIRRNLPQEVQAAQAVARDKDRILGEARWEAEALLKEARVRIERLAKEAPEVAEAERRAREVVVEAERRARELRERGIRYVDEVLERVEAQLRRVADTLAQNREELRKAGERREGGGEPLARPGKSL